MRVCSSAIWPGLTRSSRKNARENAITRSTRSIASAGELRLSSPRRRWPSSETIVHPIRPSPARVSTKLRTTKPGASVEVDRERVVGDQHPHERQDRSRPPVALPHQDNRLSGLPLTNGVIQLAAGSISTSTALKNRLIGTARRAPSGPSTQAQNTRETKVRVVESPTASPDDARLDHGLDDHVDHRVDDDDGDHQARPAFEQRDQRRRHQADDEADVGDEVGDERQHTPHERAGTPMRPEQGGVDHGDDQAEDRRHREVAAGAAGERGHGVDEAGVLLAGAGASSRTCAESNARNSSSATRKNRFERIASTLDSTFVARPTSRPTSAASVAAATWSLPTTGVVQPAPDVVHVAVELVARTTGSAPPAGRSPRPARGSAAGSGRRRRPGRGSDAAHEGSRRSRPDPQRVEDDGERHGEHERSHDVAGRPQPRDRR